jgi:ribulose-phosphate 3-epimerase
MKLAPSILSADLADLATAVKLCEQGGAELVHFDVMDGHFVPNLTFGIPVLAALRRRTSLPLDVHLMVRQPDRLLDGYLEAGADRVAVHWEAATHLDRSLTRIRQAGAAAGVALNPATPVELLEDVLPQLDFVLLMSVNPGFSGQPFLPYVLEKCRRLRRMIEERKLPVEIEMDGGLGLETIRPAVEAGVETCVAGSAVFGQPDPVAAMKTLRRLAVGGEA